MRAVWWQLMKSATIYSLTSFDGINSRIVASCFPLTFNLFSLYRLIRTDFVLISQKPQWWSHWGLEFMYFVFPGPFLLPESNRFYSSSIFSLKDAFTSADDSQPFSSPDFSPLASSSMSLNISLVRFKAHIFTMPHWSSWNISAHADWRLPYP